MYQECLRPDLCQQSFSLLLVHCTDHMRVMACRAIRELLSAMLCLDTLRMQCHTHEGGVKAQPKVAAIRPHQISKAAGLRAFLSQPRAKKVAQPSAPPLLESPREQSEGKSVENKKVAEPSAPPLSESPREQSGGKSVEVVFEKEKNADPNSKTLTIETVDADEGAPEDAAEEIAALCMDALGKDTQSNEQQAAIVAESVVPTDGKKPKFLSFWRRSKRSEPGTPKGAADSPRIAVGAAAMPPAGIPADSGTPGSLISACTDKAAVPAASTEEQDGELQNAISLDKVALANLTEGQESNSSSEESVRVGNADSLANPAPTAATEGAAIGRKAPDASPSKIYPALGSTVSEAPELGMNSKSGIVLDNGEGGQDLSEPRSLDPAVQWAEFTAEPWLGLHELSARLQAVPYHPVLLAHLVRFLLRAVTRKVSPRVLDDYLCRMQSSKYVGNHGTGR